MTLFNILNSVARIDIPGKTVAVDLGWLSRAIQWIIESIGNVGIGIIVFSLILKAVVLPFDIYQRVSMTKQNAKMKENQAKMEKLQKQYANDKAAYNQKLMEMYKENGISMFSSCLPAILSIVIFIVAINAFTDYSKAADLKNYNDLVDTYQSVILENAPEVGENTLYSGNVDGGALNILSDENVFESAGEYYIVVNQESGAKEFLAYTVIKPENKPANDAEYVKNAEKTYYVIAEKYAEVRNKAELSTNADACVQALVKEAQLGVQKNYEESISDNMKFLWVKNIWLTDASYKSPVLDYSDFKASLEGTGITASAAPYNESSYNTITAELSEYKDKANGYYILIALSIGTILLQQWVSMRSQKEQQKYSSADGSGASNQKVMMIVMTVMFAIFAFMYSAAFSIYMVTSNIVSLLMTVIINKVVAVKMEKEEEKKMQKKYDNRFPGRTYEKNKTNKK